MLKRLTPSLAAMAMLVGAPASAQLTPDDMLVTFGTHVLESGFEPDPFTVEVFAGGSVPLAEDYPSCPAYINLAPEIRISYTAGSTFPLIIGAISESDTLIIVAAPDESMHCDDDSWGDGDPVISFTNPQSGNYLVWVGTYEKEEEAPEALIVVTENSNFLNQE